VEAPGRAGLSLSLSTTAPEGRFFASAERLGRMGSDRQRGFGRLGSPRACARLGPEIEAHRVKIHALTTGAVRVTHAFLHPRSGPRRQLGLFLPSTWSEPMPIHCWAIEHEGRLLLVDTGEVATARNTTFARFEVERGHELPSAMAGAGLSLDDVSSVVLTQRC